MSKVLIKPEWEEGKMKFFKKTFIVLLCLLCFMLFGCTTSEEGNTPTEKKENKYMLAEEEASFNFFWEQQRTNPNLGGCGLIPDRYPNNGLASIASVGYGLAAFIVGVENKWITYEEARNRAILTLSHIKDLERVHGFYYHFYQENYGTIASGSEISNIDTSIFLCGALVCGEYFGGEVETLANEIYEDVEWDWFVNPRSNNFYMGYNASTNKFAGEWDNYAEQLMMYFLGAGSPTHPIEKKVYDAFTRRKGSYKSEEFIYSWFGSIFTYQFSHAFIDFKKIVDSQGVNWFENSVQATIANYNYCVDQSANFQTFGPKAWGTTACDTPTGYSGVLGAYPCSGAQMKNDGTIAPCGAIGSIVFCPEKVLPAINYYATMLDGSLIGDYGFKDAFNFENRVWIANSVIGIDKGITVLMIENYRSEIIWKTFMKLDLMDRAIQVLGFHEVA